MKPQSTSKMKLKEIEIDEDIYPRKKKSPKTVKHYVEALKGGASFPPVEVQKVKEDGEVKVVCLDGWHRVLSYKEIEKDKIEAEKWKNKILEKEENLEELRLEAAKKNISHGKRLTETDKEFQARRIVEDRPYDELNGIGKELAEAFGVTKGRMSQIIGDIISRRKASRNDLIYRMSKQGFTQREIGEKLGLDNSTVSKSLKKFSDKLSQNLKIGLGEEKSIDKIAEEHNYYPLTPWIKYLDGKSDRERFKEYGASRDCLDDEPKVYDLWRYGNKDKRLGIDYDGRTWGQICLNLLYYYSDQEDLVVDPMAGGGTMIDSCLVMNRKCRAYDIEPVRKEISENDIRTGYPKEAQDADLIYLDPPYFKRGGKLYGCQEITKDKKTFIDFVSTLAEETYTTLKDDGYTALLFGDCKGYNDDNEDVFAPELYELFVDEGFTLENKIQAPESSQMYEGYQVKRAKEKEHMLTLERSLYVFRKSISD